MAVADAASIERDVAEAFCRYVRYFASSDSAKKFAAGLPSCRVVDIDELHGIADQLHDAIIKSLGEDPIRQSGE